MIAYLIKSGLCLAILLAFYHLALEKEKMHRFNRFYLLGSIFLSFIVPALIIYVDATPVLVENATPVVFNTQPDVPQTITQTAIPTSSETTVDYVSYLLWIYVGISILLCIRFIKSLHDLTLKILRNKKVSFANAQVVLIEENILPHTFLHYIFMHKASFEANKIEAELLTHELAHVTQKHTLDVLFIEVMQILFWINPLFFWLKKTMQLNHEFLADDKVIASHQNISKYQYLLLDKAAWKNTYYLASNLNYSLTKKRLLMMKKSNSTVNILLKKLTIVPLLAGLVFLFADRIEAQTQSKKLQPETYQKTLEKSVSNQATKEQMQEYNTLMSQDKKSTSDINRIRELHSIMSDAQRESVTSINELLPKLLVVDYYGASDLKEQRISSSLFEKLKDDTKFVINLNGKRIPNTELSGYSHDDIYWYEATYIKKETRAKSSKAWQKPYHFILRTEAYVKTMRKNFKKKP